jgi:hypothetical protein
MSMPLPNQSQRVLLVVFLPTHFRELWRMARLLQDGGQSQPVFHFARNYPTLDLDIAQCHQHGIRCYNPEGEVIGNSASLNGDAKPPLRHRFIARANYKTERAVSKLFWVFGRYLLLRYLHRRVLRDCRPALIVMAEENVGYATEVLVRSAHRRGIATLILPYTLANALEPAETFFGDRRFHVRTRAGRWFAARHPHWVYVHRDQPMFRLPLLHAAAMQVLGLAPATPWVLNGGSADRIAVESEAMTQYYQRANIAPHRLTRTGMLADDILARGLADRTARRQQLCTELGLDPALPILLSGLPPNQLSKSRPECEFQTYPDLLDFWVNTLAAVPGWNRVFVLHPSARREDFLHLERAGCRIATWNTADLIPLCDLYINSVSATIRWAIACGVPVLNYDLFRYRYDDFREVKGVLTLEAREDFAAALRRLCTDPAALCKITAAQAAEAPHWGQLDGKAGERILALCRQLSVSSK